jgi:hypothetical protein
MKEFSKEKNRGDPKSRICRRWNREAEQVTDNNCTVSWRCLNKSDITIAFKWQVSVGHNNLLPVHDIDEAVVQVEVIKKLADDTKVDQTMTTAEDRDKMQAALDALCGWAITWGMEFNIPKCKVMHNTSSQ